MTRIQCFACGGVVAVLLQAVFNCLSPFSSARLVPQTIDGSRSGIRQARNKPKTAHMQVGCC